MTIRKKHKPDYAEIARLEHALGLDDDGLVNDTLVADSPPVVATNYTQIVSAPYAVYVPPIPRKQERITVEEATARLEHVKKFGNYTPALAMSAYGTVSYKQHYGV